MSNTPSEQKGPLEEIVQPFIDLFNAPRALWGINLAYVLEGMVYFGMLGYLTIYCSEYVFQAIDGADEAAHYMVMVLTAGITISMFFLGVVADKRGVRFALVTAFALMLVGRIIWAAAPTVMGFEPTRPGVLPGDKVTLHVTEIGSRYGNKAILNAELVANEENSVDVDQTLKLDLAEGDGIKPDADLESKLVRISEARVVEGDGQEWEIEYGSTPVRATLQLHSYGEFELYPGAIISLDRAYIGRNEKEEDQDEIPALRPGATISLSRVQVAKRDNQKSEQAELFDGKIVVEVQQPDDRAKYELRIDDIADLAAVDTSTCPPPQYLIRSHWLRDIGAINTFPTNVPADNEVAIDEELESWRVALDGARLEEGEEDGTWQLVYGPDETVIPVTISDDVLKSLDKALVPDLARQTGTPFSDDSVGDTVQISRATVLSNTDKLWKLQYGEADQTVNLLVNSNRAPALRPGAVVSLRHATVIKHNGQLALQANWPHDFAALNTYGCNESPFAKLVTSEEEKLLPTSRTPVLAGTPGDSDSEATPKTIAELQEMEPGAINAMLKDVYVTYVRNGGYMVQADKDGPGIFVFVSPFGSYLQIATLLGMLLVVIGYGMYQPAAYAGVRRFTNPKTAAMGFAMLYALMNLGGWLPSFAFLLRDEDYLNLGIPGVFWVYTGFTVVALFATLVILSKRTVVDAETRAKEETERIQAEEKAKKEAETSKTESGSPAASTEPVPVATQRIRPHIWLFWIGAIALILFKGKSPWYYTVDELTTAFKTHGAWSLVVIRWIIAGAVFISPAFIAMIPAAKRWIAKHPLQDAKFAYFIFCLIPVQTLFTYNWLVLPPYIKRTFEGWIGEYFEIAANANPIMIFIAVPIITAMTQKAKVYNMMIYGTFIMAAPAFLLVLGAHWWTLFGYLVIMTIGEAMWQPRFLQYAAEIAPEGRTGEYMGVAQLPWFLTKVLVPLLYSGQMMDRYCPAEGARNTETMWFIFGCIAIMSCVLLVLAKGWIGKDFKTKHG